MAKASKESKRRASTQVQYHIVYVEEGQAHVQTFDTQAELDKFVKHFPIDEEAGRWIDLTFKGNILDAGGFK